MTFFVPFTRIGIVNDYAEAMTVEEQFLLVQKLLEDFGRDPSKLFKSFA